jgi:hypothetical protein
VAGDDKREDEVDPVLRDPTTKGGSSIPKPSSRRSTPARRAPPPNSIEGGRRSTRVKREASAEAPNEGREPQPADSTEIEKKRAPRADTDPWTVPESVRDRFVQDGHRFYFPDGHPAFRDLGRKLTTASENTQVIHSLIEIARERGWNEITVTGTERFREEAWRQARVAGLNVRGFRPSDEQQSQLVRALARKVENGGSRIDTISEEPSEAPTGPGRPEDRGGHLVGKLLDHGPDAYRHDPKAEPSYFVQLQTRDGRREIWGKDLERAVTQSLTQPKIGDEVVLRQLGRDAVTIKRRERDGEGSFKEREIEPFRNRWRIEKQEFFVQREAAAALIRNEGVTPQDAIRKNPELTGTYLSLRAAELAARSLRDPEDQERFVKQVRRVLAEDIQQGEPLVPVRMRERVVGGSREVQPPREIEASRTR